MGKSAMLGSFEDTVKLSQAIPGVAPCMDFAHLHARKGDGSMNTYDEWSTLLEAYGEALGESALRDLHIHISGIAYGEKGEREHLPIGESDLNLEAILLALKGFGCRGRMLCESPVMDDDALKCKYAWLEISQENEV
jgi:deoxyribonuclease-4